MDQTLDDLESKLGPLGQTHLLKHWHDLDNKKQSQFARTIYDTLAINVNLLYEKAVQSRKAKDESVQLSLKPISKDRIEVAQDVDENTMEKYQNTAFAAVARCEVAVLLLAGGQGTRLGVNYPKGMFSVGLPSQKSLYELQAERIRRVVNMAKLKTGKQGRICWYIMTSESTDTLTMKFFKRHNYFGLNEDDVVLFRQGELPCFDMSGKIILNAKDSLALAPDGNGGVYRALDDCGIINDMENRGIKYIHAYGVDNILVKVADPAFIGYCIEKQADCGAKVIKKPHPEEPIGVICEVDGHIKVVEYSEIDQETANLRDSNGELIYNAGNICNHFFKTDFLRKIALEHEAELPLHVAHKKIPFLDSAGRLVQPQAPNGIKIEKFIFDVFQFADNFVAFGVEPFSEFSPLKNADGAAKDCPTTSRRDLLNLHRRYLEEAGAVVGDVDVEISPLLSYAGENLERFNGRTLNEPVILDDVQDI